MFILWILVVGLCLWLGFQGGRRYSDFHDLMLARRVSQLVQQADKLESWRAEWERVQGMGAVRRDD